MTQQPYRIDLSAVPPVWFEGDLDNGKSRYRAALRMTMGTAIALGVLVSDARLQTIDDARDKE